MYQTYLLKLKLLSSYMSLWQSDTIYGHLLWGYLHRQWRRGVKKE